MTHLDKLLEALEDADEVLILPHNDPDPDAIASALALRFLLAETLGVSGRILYRGIVGRAENLELIRYLGHPLEHLRNVSLCPSDHIALVDTQPGAGNNALPKDCPVAVVLDHHPLREEMPPARFVDVRADVGATSTMMTQYLRAANLEPDATLATALFYGIKTDTMGLARETGPGDVDAYFYLQPLLDVDALARVEQAQVPPQYFQHLVEALQAAHIYGDLVAAYVGPMTHPDWVAEMADMLLRLQGARWVICIGVYEGELNVAVRARWRGAGQLVQQVVDGLGTAGGHGTLAGGQVSLQGRDPEELAQHLIRRALEIMEFPAERTGRPLLHR
jgi:nanoRNase/pAp phosphatase (c-di-AMP/oligoRNAs hydrolase)